MAKYDDFGRPIYETAEEYNQAKKAESSYQTYESPEGDNYQHSTVKEINRNQSAAERHSVRAASKKGKKMVIGLAVFFVALNMLVILSSFGLVRGVHNEIYQDFDEEQIGMAGTESYDEYLSDGETPLPDGFETFTYDDVTYTLPMDYARLKQLGFVSNVYFENDSFPAEYEELLDLYDENENLRAMVRINNYSDTELPLSECAVDYFYIINPTFWDEIDVLPDFSFGDGLTFESSYEEVEAYFGTPYYHYSDYSDEEYQYDQYQWMYYKDTDEYLGAQDEVHFVQVTFYNGVIESVTIEKKYTEEKGDTL